MPLYLTLSHATFDTNIRETFESFDIKYYAFKIQLTYDVWPIPYESKMPNMNQREHQVIPENDQNTIPTDQGATGNKLNRTS